MKYIIKNLPPQEFIEYCKTPGVSFNHMYSNPKNSLRKSLADEQGWICGYCGCSLLNEDTVIEHVKPKENEDFRHLELDYSNLILSCMGGQINRRTNKRFPLSCDASKGQEIISVDPLQCDCNEKFTFDDVGNIFSVNSTYLEIETIRILNLDNQYLTNKRRAAIEGLELKCENLIVDWKEEYAKLNQKDSKNCFEEFVFVLMEYIKNYKFVGA